MVVLTLLGSVVIDACIRPFRKGRYLPLRVPWAILLQSLATASAFAALLGLSGNPVLAGVFVLAFHVLLMVVSNAKRRMLGEPLLFSDLALVGGIFRHPQFYLSALPTWQKLVGGVVLVALLGGFVWSFHWAPQQHVAGAASFVLALALLLGCCRLAPVRALVTQPRHQADVGEIGLVPSLLLYWLRWRSSAGAIPARVPEQAADFGVDLIVAVQCESFADPVALFGAEGEALPFLEQARAQAVQWGNLLVSGFGAYTMRTEYGVLFGREEEELGFRRYDPFLTALDDVAFALPRRLGTDRWRSVFVHPHDMRFYSRHRILPEAGFADLVSDEEFEQPGPGEGRYVSDAAVADKILDLAARADAPSFFYAVTMENHGPWSGKGRAAGQSLQSNYRQLVAAGDAMLGTLRDGLREIGKPALLVFFGDHRPSIPGASMPGGARHTPYVILRIEADGSVQGDGANRANITPAQLHHTILHLARGAPQ